jgi:hypothetical protein
MKNRFEQLIEYVINDEEQKARELFHDIVVEKSRNIYESLMAEEAEEESVEEAKHHDEESMDEAREEEEESIAEDDAMGRMDQYDEGMGGDQADDLIDDVSVEEEGINMEAEGDDSGGSIEDLEDRVMSLEDKLDELMAEFESELGGGEEKMDLEVDATDTPGMTNMEVDDDELETEGMMPGMMEAISLKQVHPKTTTHEEGGANTKSVNANNSGARGAMAKPVAASTAEEKGRTAPGTKDLITDFQNKAGASAKDLKPATKPHLAQATGVNTKTPFPKA